MMLTADTLKYELSHMDLIDMAHPSPEMLTFVLVEKADADAGDEFLVLPNAVKNYVMAMLKDTVPVLEMRNTASPTTKRRGYQITIMVVPEGAKVAPISEGE